MKSVIRSLAGIFGYTFAKRVPYNPQSELPVTKHNFLELFFSLTNTKDLFFLQIGANDGVSSDPIHEFVTRHELKGICVEPQPDVFRKLQETYKLYPNVMCVNALIGETSLPFYVVRDEFKNKYSQKDLTGIASFDKEGMKRSLAKKIPKGHNPEDYIEAAQIPAISLTGLLEKEKVSKIDFLQIDTEGYDLEILKMLDFKKFRPAIINLETHRFTEKTRRECENLLSRNGYHFFRDKSDTCAYLAN